MNLNATLVGVMFAAGQAATTGGLSGRVTFNGPAQVPTEYSMVSDPACVKLGGATVQIQEVEVAPDGSLRNVFVYIKSGLDPSLTFELPAATVVLNQANCQYVPRVLGVRAGQTLAILNSDPTLHNAHALPRLNKPFNIGQPIKGMVYTHTFTTPEVMVPLASDIHSWMTAFVGVMPHPFFAVTGTDGSFAIAEIPPGEYTIEAWHSRLGTISRTVAIGSGQMTTELLSFESR